MSARGPKRFVFVYGPDDYLVGRIGRARFEALATEVDEFSREVISGFTSNVGEVAGVVKQFREAVQTLGLFGGRRAVWLKDVNFLADSVTGRAEGTLCLVGDLQEILQQIDAAEVSVVITASPVDRRRSFPKWCEANSDFELAGESGGRGAASINWRALADEECGRQGVTIATDALELLVAKTGGNARLFIGELQKLATWLDEPGGTIEENHIEALVPASGEGDFFESTEAFFARNITWTLDALRRHFFAGHDARPVLTSLQNRNRILIQLRALVFGGHVALGSRGVEKGTLERAAASYATLYGEAAPEKTPFNIFTQNAWYLGKLAGDPKKLPSLRALIDHQFEFARAFEEIISRPNEQEEVLRAMAIRCLT
jgi:DNA polymerase-3 subunit delta